MSRCIFCGYCELALPVRRDHARPRLRAGRDVARRAGLHQGDAARSPSARGPAHAGRAGRSVRRPGPAEETASVTYDIVLRRRIGAGDRLGAGRRASRQPVLLGAVADHAPGLAGHHVPAAAGRLPGRRAGDRLRRRGHDHVPVRDRLPAAGADEPTRDMSAVAAGRGRGRAASRSWIEIVVAVATQAFERRRRGQRSVRVPSIVANGFFSRYLLAFEATSDPAAGGGGRRRGARLQASPARGRRAGRLPGDRERPQPELELQAAVMGAETAFPSCTTCRAADGGRPDARRRRALRSLSASAIVFGIGLVWRVHPPQPADPAAFSGARC